MRHFLERIDKPYSLLSEPVDDLSIVHDFVIDVNSRAHATNGFIKALDGHVHPGTKPPGIGKQHFHPNLTFVLGSSLHTFRKHKNRPSEISLTALHCQPANAREKSIFRPSAVSVGRLQLLPFQQICNLFYHTR